MLPENRKRNDWKDLLLASALVTGGLCVFGVSVMELRAAGPLMAQATPPLQSTPGAESKPSAPSEPVTTGTRPSSVYPQPATPDPAAQKDGVAPVLPPAPAEKTAAPIEPTK